MLNIKSFLRPRRSRLDAPPTVKAIKPSVPPGYFLPMPASELLATTRRQQWLQSIWDYSSLPKGMYRQYYLTPLEHCVALMQQFPLTESGPYARPGGMTDYMLETVSYAARLSKSYMLPVGAPPEEQAAQSAAWNAVVVYAAMLPALEYLCHLHVELENGKRWFPLLDAPPEPYRFRFAPEQSPGRLQSFGAMLAWKIIPPEAINWLSSWPEAIRTLSTYLTGFRTQSGVVNAIVSEAIRLTAGSPESESPVVSTIITPVQAGVLPEGALLSGLAENTPELVASYAEEEILAPAPEAGLALPDALGESDDTDALLAMMGFVSDGGVETGEILPSAESNDPGEAFWRWLVTGCRSGSLIPNKPDGRIHLVAGYTAIRQNQLLHIHLGDINLEERWIDLNIEGAKNHREHRVPIVSSLYPSLEELVRKAGEAGMESGDQVFNVGWFDLMRKSKYPEVMNEYPLRAFFRRLSRECKFTITPHRFRHTVATHMMKSPERNLYVVKKLLGHVSITSTLEYIDESVDSLRDILETELM